MKKTASLGLILALLAAPAWAEKPEWAGKKGGPEKAEKAPKYDRDEKGSARDRDDRYERDEDDRYDRDERGDYLPLSERERERLRNWVLDEQYGASDYAKGRTKELPPGLRKKLERGGSLPPGWQMKVQRGEVLDTELYRNAERLPRDYLERLGRRSEAAELIVLGDRIVRVAEGRGTVLDVIELTDKALEVLGN
ncbi:hypothetical protein H9C73_04415 [Marinobacterium sp. AK62]|uniref:Uncharacterized protein n=1 Tax=Marinobacterium alkalitolerans TaxID=1542925 RepID=A0ABS3Z8C8_9GAMM|nr:hypothetical protein [Marinobacterium alkalitolerans]MBP0047967.1 hypothetical protein [Marinobacterium alkalitolerans]